MTLTLPGSLGHWEGSTSPKPASPALGDLNGDGFIDYIISGNSGGDVYFYANQGSSTGAAQINPFGINPLNASGPIPALADANGDGVLDLFVGGSRWQHQHLSECRYDHRAQLPAAGLQPLWPEETSAAMHRPPSSTSTMTVGPDAFIGSGSGTIWAFGNGSFLNDGPIGLPTSTLLGAESNSSESEPVKRYETTPDVTFSVSDDATAITATIYGSEGFDVGHMHRDILHFEDWLGNELAEVVRTFWSAAISDINGDGYLDQTVIFYSDKPAAIQDDIYHGKELCLRGVTIHGGEFEACNFVE